MNIDRIKRFIDTYKNNQLKISKINAFLKHCQKKSLPSFFRMSMEYGPNSNNITPGTTIESMETIADKALLKPFFEAWREKLYNENMKIERMFYSIREDLPE